MPERDEKVVYDRSNREIEMQLARDELATILNTIDSLAATFTPQGRIVWVNAACLAVTGYTVAELEGKKVWETFVPPQEQATVKAMFEALRSDRAANPSEYSWIAKDGSLKRIAWSNTVLLDEEGQIKSIVSTGTDLTQRQEIERERLLGAIAQRIRASLDLEAILNATVAEVRSLFQIDRAIVYRFEPDGSGTVLVESLSSDTWMALHGQQIYDPCFQNGCGERYRRGRVAVVEDVYAAGLASCYLDLLVFFEVRAHAVVPLVQKERLWGLLILHHCASPRKWQESEIDFLTQLAAQVAIAIAHSELYQQIQIQLKEQQAIETVLEAIKENLEQKVSERTLQLREVNEKLLSELQERQRVEKALDLSQAHFAGILDIADDAIIALDTNQNIILFNQGAEKIFGWRDREVLGQPLDRLLPSRSVALHRQHVIDFAKDSRSARGMGERREIVGCRKDGTEFPAEASIAKLTSEGETIFTAIVRDISERKQIELMKDEFISIVSHELRTPLTGIYGAIDMLASGLLDTQPQKRQHLLNIAADHTKRLVRLVNNILDLGQLASGGVKMAQQACDTAELMLKAAETLRKTAADAGVTLSVFPKTHQLWGDRERLLQVLTHLLENAIKFSPPGSTVWLNVELETESGETSPDAETQRRGDAEKDPTESSTSPSSQQPIRFPNLNAREFVPNAQLNPLPLPPPYIQFQIKDQGRGIPPDQLEAIFERFQQVDASDSRDRDGTGLGLAICRSIIEQHGGCIWAESTLGNGSTFYVALPAAQFP